MAIFLARVMFAVIDGSEMIDAQQFRQSAGVHLVILAVLSPGSVLPWIADDQFGDVWSQKVAKTECLSTDGTSILLSNFLASFIRAGDELLFPLDLGAVGADTEIYIRHNPEEKRRHGVFQADIGYQ